MNDKYIRLIRQNETTIRGKAPYLYGFVLKDGTIVHPPVFDYIQKINKRKAYKAFKAYSC